MQVMKAIRLKLAVEKFANFFFNIPKTLFKTWLHIQIKIVCFPFSFVPAVWRLLSRRNAPQQRVPPTVSVKESSAEPGGSATAANNASNAAAADQIQIRDGVTMELRNSASMEERSLEPRSEDIIRQVKILRNSVVMSILHFTGGDVLRDSPILRQNVASFSEAYVEGDPVKIAIAKKALENHPNQSPNPMPNEEYNRMIEAQYLSANRVPKLRLERKSSIRKVVNKYGGNEFKFQVPDIINERKMVIFADVNKELKDIEHDEYVTIMRQPDLKLSLQNRCLRNELVTTNNKLEDLLRSSNNLLIEISKLNGQFNNLTSVTTKMENLECELSEGKKLLHTIEEERNEMKLKLIALEKLIKEEEDFLDDLSCESGFEEVENVCDSHDEF